VDTGEMVVYIIYKGYFIGLFGGSLGFWWMKLPGCVGGETLERGGICVLWIFF
jgi:hypothetical protein